MGPVVGDVLPLALGIAVSPIPVIAGILMLMSPKAKSTSVGFLIGWLGGIIVTTTIFTLLSALLPEGDDDATQPVRGIIHLMLGLLLLVTAARQFSKQPSPGERPALPTWMQAIDSMNFPKALGLAFLLAAVNPKNLVMAATAGLAIGSAALGVGAVTVLIIVFTVLAGSTVLVPVIGFLAASKTLRSPLQKLQAWLERENSTIMFILLLVLGVVSIGKGLSNF